MRFLLFAASDLSAVTSGKRRVDIRLHEPDVHNLLQGELLTGVFGEGSVETKQVNLITQRSVRVIKACEVEDSEAQAAGYASALDFRQRLMRHDPTVTEESLVAVNHFEVDLRSPMHHSQKPLFL